MKTKLIMVEGIPGSGKSTFAKRIADHYQNQGITVNLYNEGGFHPADLAWNACIPMDQLESTLAGYASFREEIDKNTQIEDGYAILSYTQVKTDDQAFYKDMERHEVYDGRVPRQVFNNLHIKRWKSFGEKAKQKDELTIFECAFLQNHVNDFMQFDLADAGTMKEPFSNLIRTVEHLFPLLIYLSQPNIRETIERVAKERIFPEGRWIDGIILYNESTPYGRFHGRQGLEGTILSFEDRQLAELELIASLPIQSIVLENPDYNWEKLWQALIEHLPVK